MGLTDNDILERAGDWYTTEGYHLFSTRIGPDDSTLVESVVPTSDPRVVRLYVIVAAGMRFIITGTPSDPVSHCHLYFQM